MTNGLLNPSRFGREFRVYPWYPFEDLSFEIDEIFVFVEFLSRKGCSLFRQTMPCRGKPVKFYEFSSPTKVDAARLKEWLWLGENIIWADDGTLVVNSFSDVVILSWSEDLYRAVFGQSAEELFRESKSVFTQEGAAIVQTFMELVKLTWGDRDSD